MEIKNGKKPLAAKTTRPAPINMEDMFGNILGVTPELQEKLKQKNLAHRWVGYKKLVDNGGVHERGWRPVTRKECDNIGASSLIGNDPDGFYRRGDLVLAVRPTEMDNLHKAYLRQEAQRGRQVQKKHADELRQMAKAAGIEKSISVSDGYGEENEG